MAARNHDGEQPADTGRAMERVLQAEREAETQLANAHAEAQALVAAARQQALARVNRTLERISHWQTGHAKAQARRLATLQAQAEAQTQARPATDESRMAAALEKVAAQITGAGTGERDRTS